MIAAEYNTVNVVHYFQGGGALMFTKQNQSKKLQISHSKCKSIILALGYDVAFSSSHHLKVFSIHVLVLVYYYRSNI